MKSPKLETFDINDWQFFGLWKQDLFSTSFWVSCFNPEFMSRLGIEMKEPGMFMLNGGNFFYKKSLAEDLRKQIRGLIGENDKTFFEAFSKDARETYMEGVAFAKTSASLEPTIENFDTFLQHGRNMSFYWFVAAVHLATIVEEALKEQVAEDGVPADDVPYIVPKLSTPLIEQQRELWELKEEIAGRSLEEVKKDENFFNKIEDHRKRYAWIEISNWIGDELSIETLFSQIEHAEKEEKKKDLSLSPMLGFIAECMEHIGYPKQAGAEYVSMYAFLTRPFLQKIAEQIGVTYRELTMLSHYEIRSVLKGEMSHNQVKSIIETRRIPKWMVLAQPHQEFIYTDNEEDLSHIVETLIPKVDMEVTEITGDVGNKGMVRGVVKVVMNVDEFNKLQAGEILVTTMTTPDFAVLMQKSGAIVTDIGGMLCHAAIVARELNKPCVIGTKFATQLLKDGDTVEVDADNGVVRIIKE